MRCSPTVTLLNTGHAPGTILFLSDIHQELDAAEAAGLRTVQLVRGDRDPASHHPQVQRLTTFIRSRSQHERINSFSVTDPQTPVWHSTDAKAIQDQLNAKGVRFERWQADRDLGANPSPETVIAAYQHAIDKLVAEKGYQSWDVISLRADNPQKEALREKFLNEHTHGEDEVRFLSRALACFACTLATRCSGAVRKERSDFGSRPHSALV